MNILALEASTSSAKALLYQTKTGTYQTASMRYPKMMEDISLHDAEMVFHTMMQVGRSLAQGEKIDMIALSGTWHSVMLCDGDMQPVTPVYPWCYTKADQLCRILRRGQNFVESFYHRTGCMVNATYPAFKLMDLKKKGYSLKDKKIMGQGTWHNFRLTGEYAVTECMASGSGLLNIHTKKYDEAALAMAKISEKNLPVVVESYQTFPLTKEGAGMLGVSCGIPVVLTNADGGLNQVGSGAIKKGIMTFSVGTSGAMRMSVAKPTIPKTPSTWFYLSPAGWLAGAATAGCCNCIDWFRKNCASGFSYQELEAADHKIEHTPVFLPFLFGERCPGWNDTRRAGFAGMDSSHTLADMYAAVQQGILFNLLQSYHLLTEMTGEPEEIKLSGGILNSPGWTQMCADVFQKEITVDKEKQASLMGAVIMGMYCAGILSKLEDYVPKAGKRIIPDRERGAKYQLNYQRYLEYYEKEL